MSNITILYLIERLDFIVNLINVLLLLFSSLFFYNIFNGKILGFLEGKYGKNFIISFLFILLLKTFVPSTKAAIYALTYGSELDFRETNRDNYNWLISGLEVSRE